MSQSQWYQFRYVPWKVWVKYLKMSTSDSFKIVQTPASTFFLRADTKNGQKLFLLPWNCEVSRRCQIYHVKALFLRLLPISNMSSPCSLFSEHCPPCLCPICPYDAVVESGVKWRSDFQMCVLKRCYKPILMHIFGIQCDFMHRSCWNHSNFENGWFWFGLVTEHIQSFQNMYGKAPLCRE